MISRSNLHQQSVKSPSLFPYIDDMDIDIEQDDRRSLRTSQRRHNSNSPRHSAKKISPRHTSTSSHNSTQHSATSHSSPRHSSASHNSPRHSKTSHSSPRHTRTSHSSPRHSTSLHNSTQPTTSSRRTRHTRGNTATPNISSSPHTANPHTATSTNSSLSQDFIDGVFTPIGYKAAAWTPQINVRELLQYCIITYLSLLSYATRS